MNKLEDARRQINEIDEQMRLLFEKRMEAVKDVIEYKIENNMLIFDPNRENEIINHQLGLINSEFTEYYKSFYINLITESKKFQKKIKETSVK